MNGKLNGTGKVVLAVVSIAVSLGLGLAGGAYLFGGNTAHVAELDRRVTEHMGNREVHEPPSVKEARIDDRVALHLAPLKQSLERIERDQENVNSRLDRIERLLREMR